MKGHVMCHVTVDYTMISDKLCDNSQPLASSQQALDSAAKAYLNTCTVLALSKIQMPSLFKNTT